MKCPRCNKNEAIVDKQYGVLPCEACQLEDEKSPLSVPPEFATLSKHNRVTIQRDKHAKDILQPFGKKNKPSLDFAKAYPDKVDNYFTKKELKNL